MVVKIKKYYCTICKRYHYRGKIYRNHLKYQAKKQGKKNHFNLKKKSIPTDKIIKYEKKDLRPIAKRQIRRFFRKMYLTKNFKLYTREINKIILHEKKLRCENCG
ncbi:MAG: hypothetical protein EU532_08315 [Promethearchaeota archaeon]|nr:MAG: hypothetical protein EU532_08315 [Candidatus Lokiarchaeota archaeon]